MQWGPWVEVGRGQRVEVIGAVETVGGGREMTEGRRDGCSGDHGSR